MVFDPACQPGAHFIPVHPARIFDLPSVDLKILAQAIETLGEEGAAKAEAQFRDSAPLLLRAITAARAAKDPVSPRRLTARAIAAAESLGLVGFARALSADTPPDQLEILLARSLDALRDMQRRGRQRQERA